MYFLLHEKIHFEIPEFIVNIPKLSIISAIRTAELHVFRANSYNKEIKCCKVYMKTTKTVGYYN